MATREDENALKEINRKSLDVIIIPTRMKESFDVKIEDGKIKIGLKKKKVAK